MADSANCLCCSLRVECGHEHKAALPDAFINMQTTSVVNRTMNCVVQTSPGVQERAEALSQHAAQQLEAQERALADRERALAAQLAEREAELQQQADMLR